MLYPASSRSCCSALVLIAISCGVESDRPSSPEDTRVLELEKRLRFHGFNDVDAVRAELASLRDAAERSDKRALVGAIHYPLTLYERGLPIRRFESPEDALADFDSLFTSLVLESLMAARFRDLFVRDQGAMIGGGEVWLYQFDEGVRIKAINPRP